MTRMARVTWLRPRVGTTLAVTSATVVSLLPAVLSRTSGAQAVLTGALAAMAIGIAGLLRALVRRRGFDLEDRWGQHRVPVLLVCGFAMAAATVNASHWQSGLRAAMGTAPLNPEYWLRAALGAAIAGGLLVWACRGVRGLMRVLSRLSGRARRRARAARVPAISSESAGAESSLGAAATSGAPAL
jgi:uncharacterized membrane protein